MLSCLYFSFDFIVYVFIFQIPNVVYQLFYMGGDLKICVDELILDILELQIKSKTKKKVLGIYRNFENYTRYFRVADEKRSWGAISFLNSLKGVI